MEFIHYLCKSFYLYIMTTYRELVNMILDELKLISDDSIYQEEHVIFLLDKYRMFILKQRYGDIRKSVSQSNYQTICVDLENYSAFDDDTCQNSVQRRSVQEIPYIVDISQPQVTTLDQFGTNISYVSNERFKYVGQGKYSTNTVYSTIGNDQHLYVKSQNNQYLYLKKVKVTAIFEDSSKAAELACDGEGDDAKCDVMDRAFPIEEALIPPMMELIVKELAAKAYQPVDEYNNANDDVSIIARQMLKDMRRNRRSNADVDDLA